MKRICIWLVRFYQKYLSPLKRHPTCRFMPTCSAYAIEAFQKRGFFAGLILTVWRILRCNPFCHGGYDPVPDKGFKTMGRGMKIEESQDSDFDDAHDLQEESDESGENPDESTEESDENAQIDGDLNDKD